MRREGQGATATLVIAGYLWGLNPPGPLRSHVRCTLSKGRLAHVYTYSVQKDLVVPVPRHFLLSLLWTPGEGTGPEARKRSP